MTEQWLIACVMLAIVAACSSPRPDVGGETHWLHACAENSECGPDGLRCICGSCTRACASDASCEGGQAAACYDMGSPALLERCAGLSPETHAGVCLPSCSSGGGECGGERTCVQDACLPVDAEGNGAVAGNGAVSTTRPIGTRISDFDDVNADVSWSEASRLPELSRTVAGARARDLLGTWEILDCDKEEPSAWCPSLRFSEDGAGNVRGVLSFQNAAAEPLPAASDPDTPRLPGVSVEDIAATVDYGFPGIDYPLHDARLDDGRLTFLWSPRDLYADWCAMQTPQPWTISGHPYYFCVPQDLEQRAAIDALKVAFCATAEFDPRCALDELSEVPCVCLGPRSEECAVSLVCRCDSDRCEADILSGGKWEALDVADGAMTARGNRRSAYLVQDMGTLTRVTP